MLRSERERADRVREPFAVLAVHLARAGAWDGSQVVAALEARVRATDVLARLEDGDIGVLLRNATPMSAACLAEEVQRALAAEGRLECTVYGYPPFEYGLRPGWGSAATSPSSTVGADTAAPGGPDDASHVSRRMTRALS